VNHEPDSGSRTRALIRQYTPDDAPAIFALGKLAPQAAQWSVASYEQAGECGQTVLIAEAGQEICGFMVSRLVGSQGEILNMAIAPAQQRKGIGSKLLVAAEEEAEAKSVERLYLEVRESNGAAIAFYGKHGFAKSGQRTNYYRNPTENAVVMEKKLTG
jgi:[ribosomal protein S18]-alanine N-acetyltransferase